MANNPTPEQHREPHDRFSRLMFGPFPPRQTDRREEREETDPPPLPNIDFMKLFENVSVLTDSLQQLKPLVKKISSLVDFIKK
ncbi:MULTISPECIES: hypothetical protein [Geobacillus]|jgi:hypothetical protein|uniref:hypothetical protein n=1 Tax=Geobacillus TaxID=129337 RepID=UPI000C05ACAA|nr:hypothetical protein [Geobacillus thermodenitrificans]ATO36827.1 hypothetical protein GTID1_06035 [Geobacillus thermodenitrificans]MED4916648.1 hypothetical protein [Geobacillus thermodenitrificans]